jgi:hypothetical protein
MGKRTVVATLYAVNKLYAVFRHLVRLRAHKTLSSEACNCEECGGGARTSERLQRSRTWWSSRSFSCVEWGLRKSGRKRTRTT